MDKIRVGAVARIRPFNNSKLSNQPVMVLRRDGSDGDYFKIRFLLPVHGFNTEWEYTVCETDLYPNNTCETEEFE